MRVGVVDLVVLGCVLRATTKKVVTFLSCPPSQIFPLEPPLLYRQTHTTESNITLHLRVVKSNFFVK